MEAFSTVIKKYSLLFPHLPLPIIEKNKDSFSVFIFDFEIETNNPLEINHLIDQVYNKMVYLYEEKLKLNLTEQKIHSPNRDPINIQNNTRKNNTGKNNTRKNNTGKNNTSQNNTGKNNTSQNNTGKSARSKMKIKNIQNNKYIPTFIEDANENNNNIINVPLEQFSKKVASYCTEKNISYPEYVFEKSNGVYFCKAFFKNEKFESRYAYDMNSAKEDASRLIFSYIKFLDSEHENVTKKIRVSQQKNENLQNTNFSEMFGNNENDESFDIANFFTF